MLICKKVGKEGGSDGVEAIGEFAGTEQRQGESGLLNDSGMLEDVGVCGGKAAVGKNSIDDSRPSFVLAELCDVFDIEHLLAPWRSAHGD